MELWHFSVRRPWRSGHSDRRVSRLASLCGCGGNQGRSHLLGPVFPLNCIPLEIFFFWCIAVVNYGELETIVSSFVIAAMVSTARFI